jgi:holo-[acyl-carrier protein] synthase
VEISCGVDIIEIDRIKRAVEEHEAHFLHRIFCPSEIEYCNKRNVSRHQHYAARFAAKEALVKAFGVGMTEDIYWTDIEITKDHAGKPAIVLSERAKLLADKLGIVSISLSMSHCHQYAVANVVCMKKPSCQ